MMDHVVMITGASRGIGAAAAQAFAAAGWRVALVARSGEEIGALQAEIGENALAIPCDMARWWEVEQAVAATVGTFGRLDCLVNNAAVLGPLGPLATLDPEDWDHAVDVNLKGVFHGMRAALPVMLAQGGGTVLTVSSGAAHRPVDGWSSYCAAKAGVTMLTRSLHLEHGAQGIRALGLSPGTVATDMQRRIKASGVSEVAQLDWSAHVPPDWPARALVWMAGPGCDAHLGAELSLRDDWLRRAIRVA